MNKSTSSSNLFFAFLKEYYRVDTKRKVFKYLLEDFLISIFLFSGSGLFTSIIKGFLLHLFIPAGFPVTVGKRFSVRGVKYIRIGNNVRIKDNVSITAYGPIQIGNDVIIGENTYIASYGKGLRIEDGTVVGKFCYIAQNGGDIKIGKNVLIADGVRIYSMNHKYNNRKIPVVKQGGEHVTIIIEDNVWIGSGVVIFNNITIGAGSVIGANTVVRENVSQDVVYAGNPAKIIRKIN